MKKIVKIVVLSVIAGILIALVAWGISAGSMIYFHNGRLMYGNQPVQAEGTAVSEFETEVQGINNIRLDFVSEAINVVVTDGNTIRIEEKASRALEPEELMVCEANGDTVSAVSGMKNEWIGLFNFMEIADIQVTLYVPAQYQGNYDLYSTSGAVTAQDIQAKTLQMNSTSGAVYLDNAKADSLELGSTSGAVAARGGEFGDVRANTVSGEIRLEAARMDTVDAGTTSGSIGIAAGNMPARIDANSVSGSVEIQLPENDGFTIKTDTVSGSVSNGFAMVDDTYKNGGSTISVDTVSGSISIIKK